MNSIDEKDLVEYNRRFRMLIQLCTVTRISFALGRPLVIDDFAFLVKDDGGPGRCSECGQIFQPLRWVLIRKNHELELVVKDGDLKSLKTNFGQFYLDWSKETGKRRAVVKMACGVPYLENTCLRKALERNRYPKENGLIPDPLPAKAAAIRLQGIIEKRLLKRQKV